jgi:hypothetical protein
LGQLSSRIFNYQFRLKLRDTELQIFRTSSVINRRMDTSDGLASQIDYYPIERIDSEINDPVARLNCLLFKPISQSVDLIEYRFPRYAPEQRYGVVVTTHCWRKRMFEFDPSHRGGVLVNLINERLV